MSIFKFIIYLLLLYYIRTYAQVTNQLSLAGLVEFVLHFTRLDPDMFNITRDTGSLTQTYSKFDINSAGILSSNCTLIISRCRLVMIFLIQCFHLNINV